MKKKITILPLVLMLASCEVDQSSTQSVEPSSEQQVDLTESIFNTNMIHYLGRNNVSETGVKFAMTCSGFELKVNVTEATNKIVADLDSYANEIGGTNQFAYVYIDGVEPTERLSINSATTTYTLAENLPIGEHYIRFIKLNEGVYTNITLKNLTISGSDWLQWDKTYEKKIEFYGDSITCGYGNENATPSAYCYDTQNGAHTYGYVCASELGYEPSFCAESGMSLYVNYWNNPVHFEDIYKTYDCANEFDIANYKVDIAVIALGTNDNTVFANYNAKQQETEIENIFQKYKELATAIKTNNPDCKIFFIYNLMLKQNGYLDTAIAGTCNYLNTTYGAGTAYYLEFAPNSKGGGGHPIKEAQIKDGKILADFIKDPQE